LNGLQDKGEIMTQSRWKSLVLWTAIVAQVYVIADVVGLWQLVGIEKSVITTVIDAVLQLFVIFGVINNPTNPDAL
jgi:uncharacterized membrane protein